MDSVGGDEVGNDILRRWEQRPRAGWSPTPCPWPSSSTGWPSTGLVDGYRERHGLSWQDHKLAAMDLQYHDVDPERSLYARLGMETVLEPEVGGPGP